MITIYIYIEKLSFYDILRFFLKYNFCTLLKFLKMVEVTLSMQLPASLYLFQKYRSYRSDTLFDSR